jgi:hypothetical protein
MKRNRAPHCLLTGLAAMILAALAWAGPREDLFKAIELDRAQMVRSALAAGAEPNVRDERGSVALLIALRDGSLEAAEVLFTHPGIEVDAANAAGETPLMMAALRGQVVWVQRLLDKGARINRAGWTPLHYAASGGEPRAVQLLLERGAAIDALSPNRSTPLMMAAGYGAIDSARLLAAHGADRAARNAAGLSASDFARRAGREALAAELRPGVR